MINPSLDESPFGILLTGGKSLRMGQDKAKITLADGRSLAQRLAEILGQVCSYVIEVGSGVTDLNCVHDSIEFGGPLRAICDGWNLLRERDRSRPVIVMGCDMAEVPKEFLDFLANESSQRSVVPIVGGYIQPLCAKWSAHDLEKATRLLASGISSLRNVFDESALLIDEETIATITDPSNISDVDTPYDLFSRALVSPGDADDWVAISSSDLDIAIVNSWVVQARSGGSVIFCGTVRDFSEGRPNVESLRYECYFQPALKTLESIVARARSRWPELVRIAVIHRTGTLHLRDIAVIVACSAPHRGVLFESTQWIIDTLKKEAPIWKFETWASGEDWAECNHNYLDVEVLSTDIQRNCSAVPNS